MRIARIAMMAMEDGGGASSSSSSSPVQQMPQHPAGMAYGRVEPPPFWSTPTPYLFIGFAVVMALIAVALAVLICSRRKDEEEERRRAAEAAGVMSVVRVLAPLDREDAMAAPKVLVVMAGHTAPSFLASAAPFASFTATDAAAKPPLQHGGGGAGKDGKDDAAAAV